MTPGRGRRDFRAMIHRNDDGARGGASSRSNAVRRGSGAAEAGKAEP